MRSASLMVWGLTVWMVLPASAQDGAWNKPITVDYRGMALGDVLKDIAAKAGVPIECPEKLLEGLDPVNYMERDQEAGRVATRILRPRGLNLSLKRSPTVVKLDAWDAYQPKPEAVYGFAQTPRITREGDRITIAFESKGFCDATVAIEDAGGRIVRHLASGVLGDNAPEPFIWNSKKQVVVWDGKNDKGIYVDDKDTHQVRVSLGLKPRFERQYLWSAHRRYSDATPLLAATPEGVLVCEGRGVDFIRLYDRQGEYIRTIYPFPASKVGQVKGLQTQTYPQDGQTLPLKLGFMQGTLLSSGTSGQPPDTGGHFGGFPATAMAVHDKRIAIAAVNLNRLAMDGTSGGLPIKGPKTHFMVENNKRMVTPTSMAFSPDGKTLYLTGYVWKRGFWPGDGNCFHAVLKMAFEEDKEPQVFLGQLKDDDGYGSGNDQFCVPMSVACDTAGRVYVADYGNNRVQVFSPEGKHLKSLPTPFPAMVSVDAKTHEIRVFSWGAIGPSNKVQQERKINITQVPTTMAQLGSFDSPKPSQSVPLPFGATDIRGGWTETGGQAYQVTVDTWGEKAGIWVVGRKPILQNDEIAWSGQGGLRSGWENLGVKVLVEADGKWVQKRDFGAETRKAVLRATPPDFGRQRLYFNPVRRQLYVGEDMGFCKSFDEVIIIDPETGKLKLADLPFDTEDMAFDPDGMLIMRTDTVFMRFDPVSWREIPFDYGEERPSVFFQTFSAPRRSTKALSAVPIPGFRTTPWNLFGMAVNARGHIAMTCNVAERAKARGEWDRAANAAVGKPYAPTLYPGRSGPGIVMVFDRHGNLVVDDAVQGLCWADGIGLDARGDLYVLVSAPPVVGGKPYLNGMTETLVKCRPGRTRFLSTDGAQIALSKEAQPKRPADFTRFGHGQIWAENAEWMYGGLGWGGIGGGCVCWHCRFALDEFGRSFAPETDRYTVAVLDSNGNLLMRIGKYGNVDDGAPMDPKGGPPNPRSIGGDEVALFYCAYPGVHTDRRLFLSDTGNGRILSVKLDYHAGVTVALKDVPDQK